jgi:UDP-GlcNAc:undecaprenyl-phosphate GlcNAc-1-phosphate transferase
MALVVAAGMAWILTPFTRLLAERAGAVDRPDRDRKKHRRLVPLWGGVAIFPALILGAISVLFWTPAGRELLQYQQGLFGYRLLWIVPAWTVLLVTGLIDDKIRIPPKVKLLMHILAAACVTVAGFRLHSLAWFGHDEPIQLWTWFSLLISIGWITFMTNAFNFIDGLDGLAVGQAVISGLGLALAAWLLSLHQGDLAGQMYTRLAIPIGCAVAGAGLGFWRYNRTPAKIFLGDAGSTLLGFTLAMGMLMAVGRGGSPWGPLVPLLLLAWPLTDASMAVWRRWKRREPISKADHRHLHHRLLDQGFTPGAAVAFIRTMGLIGTVLALVAAWV